MQYTEDREAIKQWAPLLVSGRDDLPVAATKMSRGTDVNFGSLSSSLIEWLGSQNDCGYATEHRVIGLNRKTKGGWSVKIKDLKNRQTFSTDAKFVFIIHPLLISEQCSNWK